MRDAVPALLPPPASADSDLEIRMVVNAGPPSILPPPTAGAGWSIVDRQAGAGSRAVPGRHGSANSELNVVRQQRDALARQRRDLIATIRRLEAENDAVRRQLERYQTYPSLDTQEAECAHAQALERERGVVFHHMPDGVYPGKPYVTQQDLIGRGITRYSRQNISRLTRDERTIPAVPIADRILLPPAGVEALLAREGRAAHDASPRRRPGRSRRG